MRTIGIALVPPFLWVLFGGTPTFSRIPDWTRKHRVACFGILLVAGSVMILAGRQALHSRYLQFNEPIFVNRGFARSLWANLTDHSKEWGEIILNLPVSKLPRGMAIPVQLLGLLALLIFSVVLWQQRKKFTVVLCYISAFSAIVLAYPWFDTRLWLPVLPFIFIYLFSFGACTACDRRFCLQEVCSTASDQADCLCDLFVVRSSIHSCLVLACPTGLFDDQNSDANGCCRISHFF